MSIEDFQVLERTFVEDYVIVYYDVETTGFGIDSCGIVQIAAKAEKCQFSVYVTPNQNIEEEASEAIKLTNKGPKLFYDGLKVETVSITEASAGLQLFLKQLGKKFTLIVCNDNRFDHSLFVRTIEEENMIKELGKSVFGFTDSLPLFKKTFPDRVKEFVTKKNDQRIVRSKMPNLNAIRKITSICKKIIAQGMTYEALKDKFNDLGQALFRQFLKEKVGRVVHITGKESFIENIIKHFSP